MPEEGSVSIFKNKGDVQSCRNYQGKKLMKYTLKLQDIVVEARLRAELSLCEQSSYLGTVLQMNYFP